MSDARICRSVIGPQIGSAQLEPDTRMCKPVMGVGPIIGNAAAVTSAAGRLLKEGGGHLLLQSGGKIVLG